MGDNLTPRKGDTGATSCTELATISSPNRNFTKLSNMPVVHLVAWLSRLEPISFSKGNLAAVLQRGAREQSRTAMSEISQYILEWDPDSMLFEEGRDPLAMDKWWYNVVATYKGLGRRGRQLMLPPDWEKCGVYEVLADGQAPILRNKLNKRKAVIIPANIADAIGQMSHAKILMNFPETRASLVGGGLVSPMRCMKILEIGEPVQAAKRPRRMPALASTTTALQLMDASGNDLAANESAGDEGLGATHADDGASDGSNPESDGAEGSGGEGDQEGEEEEEDEEELESATGAAGARPDLPPPAPIDESSFIPPPAKRHK